MHYLQRHKAQRTLWWTRSIINICMLIYNGGKKKHQEQKC